MHFKHKEEARTERLSIYSQASYSLGSVADCIFGNIVLILAMPIYNIALGVDAALIGIAMCIPRIWDAISDPIMGYFSDNTRTRFGRRRPYIFIGAILAGLMSALMWMPPLSLDSTGLFIFFLVTQILFFTAFTVYSVPFHAMGLELTSDYNGRTKVQAYKACFVAMANIFLMPFMLRLCFYDGFGNSEIQGVRVVGVIFGALAITFGVSPAILCKEINRKEKRLNSLNSKLSVLEAIKCTCSNQSFRILSGLLLSLVIGIFIVLPITSYINIYHVAQGDKALGAKYISHFGIFTGITNIIAIPVTTWFAGKLGKKKTVIIGMAIVIFAYLASWFLFTPNYPYLALVYYILFGPSLGIIYILLGSMCADICDTDELLTGFRREAMYASVYGWFFKLGVALVLMLSGFMIKFSGINPEIEGGVSLASITRLRLMFTSIPALFLLMGIYFAIKFPLTKKRILEVQKMIEEQRLLKDVSKKA